MTTYKTQLAAIAAAFTRLPVEADDQTNTIGSVTVNNNADGTIHVRATVTNTKGRKFIDSYNWSPMGGLVWCDLQEVTL